MWVDCRVLAVEQTKVINACQISHPQALDEEWEKSVPTTGRLLVITPMILQPVLS